MLEVILTSRHTYTTNHSITEPETTSQSKRACELYYPSLPYESKWCSISLPVEPRSAFESCRSTNRLRRDVVFATNSGLLITGVLATSCMFSIRVSTLSALVVGARGRMRRRANALFVWSRFAASRRSVCTPLSIDVLRRVQIHRVRS